MADQQDSPGSRANQPTKLEDLKGIRFDHAFYVSIALKAAADLRIALKIDEGVFRRIAPSAWQDPRPAFIYRVLDELQKAGLCINEWFEKLEDDSTPDPADHETRLYHQWLLDEQNFRARKLTEVLVDLVCFSATNEPRYYRDYLQLRELDATVRSLNDQEEFFGFRRRNSEYIADLTMRSIIAGEEKLDPSKRWYLEEPGLFQERWRTRGVRFSSFRKRYIRSLELALPNERAALGQTYMHVYGSISGDIHFTPQETSWDFDPETVYVGFNRVGLLCYAILIRCQDLLGVIPEGINAWLRHIHDENKGPAEIVGELKQEKAEVGDYVWADGHICEVMDIVRSKVGYVSYLLRYAERPPIPEIKEDWYRGLRIPLVAERSFVEGALRELQSDPRFRDMGDAKQRERLDQAIAILWRAQNKAKLQGNTKTQITSIRAIKLPD